MKGVDNQLEENLASAFKQAYPTFEVIMTVADEDDPAVEVAKKVMATFPNVDARVVIGSHRPGRSWLLTFVQEGKICFSSRAYA